MKTLTQIAEYLFPLFILLTVLYSFIKKKDTVSCFAKGFKNGAVTMWEIMPNITAVMVATALFRKSGAFSYFAQYLTPFFSFFNIPEALYEMIIMRPVSGSGAIALLNDILKTSGADSFEGLTASVIAASTETTLYTAAVYFGITKVKKTGIPVVTGLIADFFTVLFSMYVVKMFFY